MAEQSAELHPPILTMAVPQKTEAPAQSAIRVPEQFLYKNRLQEYTQKSVIPLPVYHTTNEGAQHAPRFRSTVLLDGTYYMSPNTFSHRKAAEQDVARVALLGISQKIKDEGSPLIREDTVFCKSILNEYSVKMNLERPEYKTIQPEGLLPVFISSVVFNGGTYTGDTGKNKKEAEQLAARAVILSILDSESRTIMSEIIKSKLKLYAALNKVKDPCNIQNGILHAGIHTGYNLGIPLSEVKEVEVSGSTDNMPITAISEPCLGQPANIPSTNPPLHVFRTPNNMPITAIPEPCSGQPANIPSTHPPIHVFRTPKPEASSQADILPIVFVPPVLEQPLPFGSSSGKKRTRKTKKRTQKKVRVDASLPVAMVPLSQVPPCSVAQ